MTTKPDSAAAKTVKQCCAQLYESDLAKTLLGDSFHPGGLCLTERLGILLNLTPEACVLDVASGTGASAFFLAERFGCHVVGVDYGSQNVAEAKRLTAAKGLASRVQFERGDAERLHFPDGSFDAVLCECALCTFPHKSAAAREFARVLRPGGNVGLSDLTRTAALPQELDGLLARIACIGDAQSAESYAEYLRSADLDIQRVEYHDEVLTQMVQQIRTKLLIAEVLVGLKELALPNTDFASAKDLAQNALAAIQRGHLGYVVLTAVKSALPQTCKTGLTD
jgi:ubiquinone/menaquinone biosynthesis C-methylase UbiE